MYYAMAKNGFTMQKYDMFLIIANCFVFYFECFLAMWENSCIFAAELLTTGVLDNPL